MTGDAPTILIVEDEPPIRRLLRTTLAAHDYRPIEAGTGAEALSAMRHHRPDLVLLDLGLPGEDGLALMRALRHESSAAVIVVTGRGDTFDRIVGLEVGADDYIAKPFDVREVGARVRSVLRRTLDRNPGLVSAGRSDIIRFAGWTLDLGARRLESPRGTEVNLTTGEFDLLAALAGAPGRVLSRDELLEATRNREAGPFDRTIDVQVGRLRRKIEADPQHPELIKSVRGAGYVFTSKVERG